MRRIRLPIDEEYDERDWLERRRARPKRAMEDKYYATGAGLLDTDLIPNIDAIDDALVDKKLVKFMEKTWSLVVPGTNFLSNWHLEAIGEHLEAVLAGQIKRLIINIPPRCCKSLSCNVFFPAFAWAQDPTIKWIFSSHQAGLAVRDSIEMRRLIESDWYQNRYKPDPLWRPGDTTRYAGVRLEKDQNAKAYYQNTAAGHRLAIGVGSGLTGHGADIIVVDDPHDATEAVTSEASRQHVQTWWSGTLSTRLNPGSRYGAKILIMQRLHQDDLVGHLLDKRDKYLRAKEEERRLGISSGDISETDAVLDDPEDINWDHLCLPAEFIRKHPIASKSRLGFVDPRKNEGDLLWPAGLSKNKIISLRVELGSQAASGQLDQYPVPMGGGQLQGSWFRRLSKAEWPTEFDTTIQSWDLSYSDDPTADYTVGFVMSKKGPQIYIRRRIRGQLAFNQQIRAVEALTAAVPEAAGKYVEKAANAVALENTLCEQIPGIILVFSHTSKVARAWAWAPYLEAGNICVPDWEPWVDEFIAECQSFPLGKHDDQVDAASLGINTLMHGASTYGPMTVDVREEERSSDWSNY